MVLKVAIAVFYAVLVRKMAFAGKLKLMLSRKIKGASQNVLSLIALQGISP